jgi:hypothetical protein
MHYFNYEFNKAKYFDGLIITYPNREIKIIKK